MDTKKGFFVFVFLISSLSIFLPISRAESFRFIVTSDTHYGSLDIIDEIVEQTINSKADFILIAGDLVEQGTEAELLAWRDAIQPLYDANIGVYPIRGNHDNCPKSGWDNVFSGDYALPANGPAGEENITYSFTFENAFIVGLDQYVKPHRINQQWLDGQFASNTQLHVFVFGHESAFRLYHEDTLNIFTRNRDIFWNSMATEGVKVYFCGHDHFYDHARLDDGDADPNNDVHQIVVNGSSKTYDDIYIPYNGNNSHWTPVRIEHEQVCGYMVVEIDGPNATLTWKQRISSGVFEIGDVFSYTLGPFNAPPVNIPDANLKAVITNQLGVSEPNTIDMLSLIYLDANSMAITNLSGLEYAKNLTELNIGDNLISDISALTYLCNLQNIYLKNNPIDRKTFCVDFPLITANNPGLYIESDPNPDPCDDCIVDFADCNLKAAVEVELGIQNPEVSDMLELFSLSCDYSGIVDLFGLEYAENILWLNLSQNQINDISLLSANTKLTQLFLGDNQISNITALSKLFDLYWLRLENNNISDISSLVAKPLLEYLYLGSNPLDTAAYCTYFRLIDDSSSPTAAIDYDPNPNPLTNDCSTSIDELSEFASHWLDVECNELNSFCGGADMNHLNDVDFDDFAQFAQYWLKNIQ